MKKQTKPENLKKKKLSFIRTDAHKKKKLKIKWRRPRGIQNKRRLRKRGYLIVVKKGYRTRKQTRGLIRDELKLVMINNISELECIDKNSELIVISSDVGNKKRLEILEQTKKQELNVVNFDVDTKIKQIKELMDKKKKEKEEIKKKKEKKVKQEKKKTIEESVKKEEKEEPEEEKDKEKKEFDKLLTKKS